MIDWTACAPEGGWKASAYYVVSVKWRSTNPAHLAILYTGFLGRDGTPGAYSGIFNPAYERGDAYKYVGGLYSLRVVSEITDMKEGPE